MTKKPVKKRPSTKTNNRYSVIAGIFTLVLFILLAIGSLFLQKKVNQESQDIRQEAWSSDQGQVYISSNPPANSSFQVNQPVTLEILFNTTNAAIDGIQLKSTIEGSSNFLSGFNVSPNDSLNNTTLDFVKFQRLIASSTDDQGADNTSYGLDLIAITDQPEVVFTTNNNEVVLYTYTFTPTSVGTFTVSFDEESFAINHTDHASDELRTDSNGNPPVFTYYVVDSNNPCTETDNGVDYYNYGETTGTILADVPEEYTQTYCDNGTCRDYCIDSGPNVFNDGINEWSCTTTPQGETGITANRIFCPYGCSNGACLPNPYPPVSITPTPTSTQSEACVAPVDFLVMSDSLSCNDNNTINLELAWTNQAGVTRYQLNGYNLQDDSQTVAMSVSAYATTITTVNLNNLAEGTWYFNVSASTADSCDADGSNFSELYTSYSCEDEQYCRYVNCDYGSCNNGYQSVTCYASSDSDESCADSITQTMPCMTQCVYECEDWGACTETHLQERTCSANNTPCWDYSGNNRGQSYTEYQYCDLDSASDILFTSYELCWYDNSNGESVYIAWDKDNYYQVDWVDISANSDFSKFAHKNVESANTEDGYGVTNGQNFNWNDDQSAFTFSPDVTYYVRLYYRDSNGVHHHSRTATFRMNKCAGTGGDQYQQCNESCSSNADCTSGLYCKDSLCRLPANPDSTLCIDPNALSACGEWCADNSECASGLSCWYNYCRNPLNIDIKITDETRISLELEKARQTDCATWSPGASDYLYTWVTTKGGQRVKQPVYSSSEATACNQYCSSNAQCEMNMRCYQNSCRLAVDPEDETCGGVVGLSYKSASGDETMTTPSSSLSPSAKPMPTSTPVVEAEIEESALDALVNYLAEKGISLTVLLAVLGGFLALIIIFALLGRKKEDKGTKPSAYQFEQKVKPTNMPVPPSAMINDSFDKQNKSNLVKPGLTGQTDGAKPTSPKESQPKR